MPIFQILPLFGFILVRPLIFIMTNLLKPKLMLIIKKKNKIAEFIIFKWLIIFHRVKWGSEVCKLIKLKNTVVVKN